MIEVVISKNFCKLFTNKLPNTPLTLSYIDVTCPGHEIKVMKVLTLSLMETLRRVLFRDG